MGIYDRDYARDDRPGVFLGGERTMVTNLLLVTVGIYILQILVDPSNPRATQPIAQFLALRQEILSSKLLTHPWWIFELVTYGFAHSRNDIMHILGNMFLFWFFGRDIEAKYGKKEFLSIYLTTIVLAGLAWLLVEYATGSKGQGPPLIGASGGVMGVMLLYVLHFPKRTLLIWGIIPVPAWALAAVWLLMDIQGAIGRSGNVAYSAHLAGAAYGFAYYRTGWTLAMLLPGTFSLKSLKRRPKLRVHDPDEHEEAISQQVDEILRKIQEQGQDSLTAKERRTLERASRRYQQKHR